MECGASKSSRRTYPVRLNATSNNDESTSKTHDAAMQSEIDSLAKDHYMFARIITTEAANDEQ
jgi:hypothetical protein